MELVAARVAGNDTQCSGAVQALMKPSMASGPGSSRENAGMLLIGIRGRIKVCTLSPGVRVIFAQMGSRRQLRLQPTRTRLSAARRRSALEQAIRSRKVYHFVQRPHSDAGEVHHVLSAGARS